MLNPPVIRYLYVRLYTLNLFVTDSLRIGRHQTVTNVSRIKVHKCGLKPHAIIHSEYAVTRFLFF